MEVTIYTNPQKDLYDLIYNFKDYKKESNDIKDYILARFPDTKTILVVACGTGKHIEYLNKNFSVDGIDISQCFVEIALIRNPASTLWCMDMVSFELEKQHDVIICLFSAIAYANSFNTLSQTLKQMKKHTKIEPWFTPETWNPGSIIINNGGTDDIKVTRMGLSEKVGNLSILNFEYLAGTKNGITHLSEKHKLGLYSVEEMFSAFKTAGLESEYDPEGISDRGMYISKSI